MTLQAANVELLYSRLTGLERQCRRMKRTAVVILTIVPAALFCCKVSLPFISQAKGVGTEDEFRHDR